MVHGDKMKTLTEVSGILNINKQNTKKLIERCGMEITDKYSNIQVDTLKENCYKYQKEHSNRTMTNLAKELGISRQRLHIIAINRGVISKSNKKGIILTKEQVKQLQEIYNAIQGK